MNSFKAALVGLPNVGKSLIFNILVNQFKADSQNYPFCTIEPNEAIVSYDDDLLIKYQQSYKSLKIVPEMIKFYDIAGIISGAATGVGLGNEFLSHIYTTDCVIYVIRCFINDEILHVYETVDSIRDFKIIRGEFIQKDLQVIESYMRSKNHKDNMDILKKCKHELEETLKTGENHLTKLNNKSIHLLSYKPFIIVCNGDAAVDTEIQRLITYCEENKYIYSVINAAELELNIATSDNKLFINDVICKCRQSLGMTSFFTCGPEEIHAWPFYIGENIRNAVEVIHSDFTKKFIKAKVTSLNTAVEKVVDGSYIVQYGDIVTVMHNK